MFLKIGNTPKEDNIVVGVEYDVERLLNTVHDLKEHVLDETKVYQMDEQCENLSTACITLQLVLSVIAMRRNGGVRPAPKIVVF